MRIEFTSHYQECEDAARDNGCYLMSVQNARTFYNFNSEPDAQRFIDKIQPRISEVLWINTQRGGGIIPAEVSVPHGKWIY